MLTMQRREPKMMGRQINFYLMKEDILEVDEYIRKNEIQLLENLYLYRVSQIKLKKDI